MGKKRPKWPSWYYPSLRKEVNFGCAVCGKPIPLTIHHIEGYVDGVLEKPERLIMLCNDIHHPEADNGQISKSKLYQLKKKPFNSKKINHQFKSPPSGSFAVHIGSNQFIATSIPLRINGIPYISVKFEKDVLLFSAKFYDKDDKLKLEIFDNVWKADTEVADIRYEEGKNDEDSHLGIKMHDSESYLHFIINGGSAYISGKFYAGGKLFDINDQGVFVFNKQMLTMTRNIIIGCEIGIDIQGNSIGLGGSL